MEKKVNIKDYRTACSMKTLVSEEKGFFTDLLTSFQELVGNEWVEKKFSKIKNDKDKLKCLFTDKKIKNELIDILENVRILYRIKDSKLSLENRVKSEKLFESKENIEQALILANRAVIKAPKKGEDIQTDDGLSLYYALHLRSKILIFQGKHKLALQDLQLMLKDANQDQKCEIYFRMAKCYENICDVKKAEMSYKISEKFAYNSFLKIKISDELEKFQKLNIQPLKNSLEQNNVQSNEKLYLPINAEIKNTKDSGRQLFSKCEIKTGETILKEEPYSSCLKFDFFGSHCYHCYEKLMSPIPCETCSAVGFCSISCFENSKSYHQYECKIMDFLIGSGMSVLCHLALRMVTQNSLKKSLEIYEEKCKLPVYQLCTLAELRDNLDFFYRSIMAMFLVKCLNLNGYFKDSKLKDFPNENHFKIGELVFLHLQFLQFNAYEISELVSNKDNSKNSEISKAIGVYSFASLLNHSCYPSVARYFDGRKIIIKAIRPISVGEGIYDNYGPTFTVIDYEKRHECLLSRYWFDCKCQACLENWPKLNDINEYNLKLRCPTKNCPNMFQLPELVFDCSKCKLKINLEESLNQLTNCEKMYKEGETFFENGQFNKAIDLYIKATILFHSIAMPPHKETHKAENNLKICWWKDLIKQM